MKKTKSKPSPYSLLLTEMRNELQNLINIKPPDNEDQSIEKVQAKWNAIVNCTNKWFQIAENILETAYLKEKFQTEGKKALIVYGTTIISEVNSLACTNPITKYKKRQFLEELNDRLLYIRNNY